VKRVFKVALLLLLCCAFLICSCAASKKACDINGDGVVNLMDVLRILRIVGSAEPNGDLDVNGDGVVSVADALIVLKDIVNNVHETYTYVDIVERLTNTKYLSLGNSDEESELFSSYDRKSKYVDGAYKNWRVNGDGSNVLGTTEDGGHLIADITGAGYISRIWSATSGPGHVKIYIDGETEPTIDLPFTDFFNCNSEPFVYDNLVYGGADADAARGKNNYVPITFSKSCKVVAYGGFGDDGWGKYYHINYTLFPDGTKVEPMPKVLSAEQKAALENANLLMGEKTGTHPDGYEDAAFETFTVSKEKPYTKVLTGRGAISGLLARVDSIEDDVYATSLEAIETLKNLRIKIYWDGEIAPSVNAPLGDFFASSYGFNEARMLLLGVRADRTMYNYFYMPYLDSAKIEIYTVGDETETVSLSVNVVENTLPAADIMYYGTQFTLGHYHPDALDAAGNYDKSAARNPDYHFLTVKGAGKLVGLTLHHNKTIAGIDPLSSPGSPWWGEGDEKFFVDGEKFPSWFGTGTEDFFGYAWCSPLWFTKPYHAQSYCEGGSNGIGNRVLTRLLVGDAIPFDESFEGYMEKYYTDEYTQYSFTSYFYLAKDSMVEDVDYDDTAVLDYYVPSSEGAYLVEGEDLYVKAYNAASGTVTTSASGHIDHQSMASYSPAWSKGAQLIVYGLGAMGSIDFTLPAPADGEYMLLASFANAPDFSVVQVSVNGEKVGAAVDTYGTVVAADYLTELGKVTLTKGNTNTLTLANVGRNSAATSSAYRIALDFVLMVPVDEYKSLAELDLTKYTDIVRINTKRDIAETDTYVFEGETDLIAEAIASDGTPTAQTMTSWGSYWSGGKQMFLYNKTVTDATLNTYFWVEETGTYDFSGAFTVGGDYGKYKVTLNDSTIGNMDFYNSSVAHKTHALGLVTLKAGYNKLTFSVNGKNGASLGYCIGIDCITATKVEESDIYTFEGETDLLTNTSATVGTFVAQTMSGYSGGKQLWWRPGTSGVGGELTTSVTVDKAGAYKLYAALCTAKDYGAFDLYVNGTKITSFDGYSPTLIRTQAYLGEANLNAGTNTIKIVITGKAAASTNYMVGIDFLRLYKVN